MTKKSNRNAGPVDAVRTSEEVNSVIDAAAVMVERGRSKFPGMTYEEGVRAALDWILGNIDDHPMED